MPFLLKTSKYLFLSIIFILIALPYAAKFGAVYYLENEKNIKADISDISINFFTGKIGLEGVHLYGKDSGELHLGKLFLDISTTALFQKNILIESLVFHNFSSNITEQSDGWNVGGIFIPIIPNDDREEKESDKADVNSSKNLPFGIGIQSIDFLSVKTVISSQYTDSNIAISKFKISDLKSWNPGTASSVEIDLSINDKILSINGEVKPFMEEPSLKTKVAINNISISPFLKSVKDLPFTNIEVSIFSDFALEVSKKDKALSVKLDGSYGLKDILLEDAKRKINLSSLIWQGKHNILLPIPKDKTLTNNTTNINLDGVLSINEIDIQDAENNAHLTQEKIALSGTHNILLSDNADIPSIKASLLLTLDQLNINTLDDSVTIASFNTWKTSKIVIDEIDNIKVGQSKLNNLVVLKENTHNEKENKKENKNKSNTPASIAQLKTLTINDISYKPEAIKINTIKLSRLTIDATLDEESSLPLIKKIAPKKSEDNKTSAVKANKPPKTETTSSASNTETNQLSENTSKPITITLNEFSLNQKSHIRFTDNSVVPPFHTSLHELGILVKNIDSSKKSSRTDINLDVKIDEYATFNVKGYALPFSEKANANLKAKLNGLELVPLSSYAGKFAGINIKRGTLDIDADIKVKNDILDVNNTFYLNKLVVESDENEVNNNIFQDMPMPLDLTLDVLRDKNNIIKLDIPVKGDVNNPDFSLQDVYNTAMVKAMKFAATHYLTQAIQPLGLVIAAGKIIGKVAAPRFDPLIYNPGTVKISKTNQKHIKKLAKILQEKDKLKFTICGIATESDWQFLQAQNKANKDKKTDVETSTKKEDTAKKRKTILLQLANQRTKEVKKYFVTQYKIKPKRLFTCNGKIYKDKKDKPAIPAVEIGL